jgi:aminoglycoside phosphotransferase (APT) family kinase protein
MSALGPEFAAIAHLLPEEHVGTVTAIAPISTGASGAAVYAVTTTRGEFVLRVSGDRFDAHWPQQLRIMRRAAERGIAPAIVHVDEAARAIVSVRVQGLPFAAALMNPASRDAAIASIVAQLRALHALDTAGVQERDPIAFAREQYATQRVRPGFPVWAAALDSVFDGIEVTLAHDRQRVASHNDINPGNVLWDGTRVWLVDWEVAGLAHPFYDLATLALFIRLEDEVAFGLLAMQEQRAIGEEERATFVALRRLAALLCGLVFASMVEDLSVLPEGAPTLLEFYGELRAGRLDLQAARGRGAFAAALLREGSTAE